MPSTPYDAFISYASPNLDFAEEAHHRLTAAGFKVWFDKRELDPGVEWHKRIKLACEASRVVLPVLTPDWQLSDWTKFETYGSESIIPLIVRGEVDEIFTPRCFAFKGIKSHRTVATMSGKSCSRCYAISLPNPRPTSSTGLSMCVIWQIPISSVASRS